MDAYARRPVRACSNKEKAQRMAIAISFAAFAAWTALLLRNAAFGSSLVPTPLGLPSPISPHPRRGRTRNIEIAPTQ